jgi:amidase
MAEKVQAQLSTPTWQDRVARKRADCLTAIPAAWRLDSDVLDSLPKLSSSDTRIDGQHVLECSGILSKKELEITQNYTASQLLQKLADGALTSVAVTEAFSKRAAVEQQLVCIF